MEQPTNAQLIEQLGAGAGTFAARMAEIANGAIRTDHEGSMLHIEFLQNAAKAGNLVVIQSEDLGVGLGVVSRRDERSIVTAVRLDRLGFETVEMDFAMTVGAKTTAMKDTEVKVGSRTEASASGGYFFAKAGFKETLTADVRHQDKQTRDTDMSATINVRARMSRLEAPEGTQGMADVANEFTRRAAELRLRVALARVERRIQQIENGEVDAIELSETETKENESRMPESDVNGDPAGGGSAPAPAAGGTPAAE